MGANNFVAFATVPAGAQVGAQAAVDLWTLVPANGLDPGFNVMCTGDFVGQIAVEGSLDGIQFNPVGAFTLGAAQLVGPFEPSFELAPFVVNEVVRYLRLRVMPGTTVRSAVFVTAGGAQNCDCTSGGPDPYDLDPENVDNLAISPGTVVEYSRGDHVHGLTFPSNEGEEPENVLPASGSPSFGTNPRPSREDHVHILDSSVITGYLSEIYALGVADDPIPDNTLAGTAFGTYFAPDGSVQISESGSGDVNLTLRKHSQLTPGVTLTSARYITKMDFGGSVNTSGGVGWEYAIENQAGTQNIFNTGNANVLQLGTPSVWYVPSLSAAGSPQLSYIRWQQQNRRGSGATSQVYFNSDGVEWRQSMFPASGGPYILYAEQISMNPTAGGGAEPEVGSTVRHATTGPATGPDDGIVVALAGHDEILTAKNLGSAQIEGRFDIWTATLTGGPSVRASYSNTSLGVVDIVSATQDLKTAATFTVVPQATGVQLRVGARFLPIAAYVEFVTVAALATGPTLKIGSNVAHDNVAPALVVANTVVTDDATPFVMAVNPAVIDMTAGAIICELTANATGTTCQARVHLIGVYVNVS